uniref:hypothetical protein n=1 Tax=Prevotella sp. TaxID=59823 RepID=UPI004029FC99
MKRKQKRVTLLLASLLVGGFLVTGCTNSDYDFNEIDATMGFGGDGLELPASSTMDIPLKDVLDLEENGSVKLDGEGNYLFQLTGSGSSEANPKIEPIRLEGRSYNANIPISLSASAKATRSLTASSGIPEVKEKMFEYHGVDKSVKSLTKANMKPVTMKLTLGFSGISSVISKIKKATLTLPGYLSLNRVVGDGNDMPIPTSSRIDIADISTSRDLVLTITSNKLLFSEQDAYGTLSIAEDGKIDMDGYFGLKIDDFELTGTPSTANMSIAAKVEVENIELTSATGVFDPEVNFGTLGEVDVTGVPDFLSDDNVVADLANPQILLTINNEMNVAATVKATVTATKSGQTTATVQLPEMYIEKNSVSPTTQICICREKTPELTAQYGEKNVYAVSNLSTLINKIPDHVSIGNVEARADQSKEATVEFGKPYHITPSYEVYAPLAFGKDAVIEYSDQFDGWNDDIDDLELSENTYVRLTADAISKVPAALILEATPLGVGGADISNLIEVNIKKGEVSASTDGETAVTSPLEVEIREKVKGGLKQLDGLSYKIQGKATHNGTTVEGITLNANKHTLKLNNIKVKLVGKIIGDFN